MTAAVRVRSDAWYNAICSVRDQDDDMDGAGWDRQTDRQTVAMMNVLAAFSLAASVSDWMSVRRVTCDYFIIAYCRNVDYYYYYYYYYNYYY